MMTEASLNSLMTTTTYFTVSMVDLSYKNYFILRLILTALWIRVSCWSSTLMCMSLNFVMTLTSLTSPRTSGIRYTILSESFGPSLIARV